MSLHAFGTTAYGRPIAEARLSAPSGLRASVIELGASLRDLEIPVPGGARQRVVLGFGELAAYEADPAHFGAIAGRCANRIGAGRFALDGKDYQLPLNEAGHTHLHGGMHGFGRRPWRAVESGDAFVTLALDSPKGDEGYPGSIYALCTYRLVEPATLSIEMTATTDAPTLVNFAHHSYFTLSYGQPSLDHEVQVNAERYTVFNERLVPTGELRSVAGTPYDFRRPHRLGARKPNPDFFFDINFALDRAPGGMAHLASLFAPSGGLRMEVHSTEPGMQLYDGNHLGPRSTGIDGRPLFKNAGVCFEPGKYPDGINHANFPSPVLRPGEVYRQVTEYRFVVG